MTNLLIRYIVYAVLFLSIRALVGGFASLYLISHGMSIADVSMLKSLQAIIVIVAQVPLGYWIDSRKNRYPYFVASMVMSGIWLVLTGVGGSKEIYFVAEAFNGLGVALFGAVLTPIMVETYFKETKRTDYSVVLGKYFKFQHMVMAAFVIIGGSFTTISSPIMWYVAGGLLLALAMYSVIRNDKANFTREASKFEGISVLARTRKIISLLSSRELVVLFISNVLLATVFQSLAQYWQIILYEHVEVRFEHSAFYGISFACILLIQAVAAHYAERHISIRTSALMSCGLAVGSLLVMFGFGELDFYKAPSVVMVLALFLFMRYPLVIASDYVHRAINDDVRSIFDSVLSTFSTIVAIGAFIVIGVLADSYGTSVILVSVAICAAASVVTLVLARPRIVAPVEHEQTVGSL